VKNVAHNLKRVKERKGKERKGKERKNVVITNNLK